MEAHPTSAPRLLPGKVFSVSRGGSPAPWAAGLRDKNPSQQPGEEEGHISALMGLASTLAFPPVRPLGRRRYVLVTILIISGASPHAFVITFMYC